MFEFNSDPFGEFLGSSNGKMQVDNFNNRPISYSENYPKYFTSDIYHKKESSNGFFWLILGTLIGCLGFYLFKTHQEKLKQYWEQFLEKLETETK